MLSEMIYKAKILSSESETFTDFHEFISSEYKTSFDECSTVYEVFKYESSDTQGLWNTQLINNNALIEETESVEDLLRKLRCAMHSVQADKMNESIINDAEKAFLTYIEDTGNSPLNKFSICSINSLKQFARYIPSFGRVYHNVYIDKDTGFFGVMLKRTKASKPLLNLLLQENGEVTFSFVERKKGMVKISGRAYFNHNLEDSSQVKHLLRMIKS